MTKQKLNNILKGNNENNKKLKKNTKNGIDLNLNPHLKLYSAFGEIKKATSFRRTINPRSRRLKYGEGKKNEESLSKIHYGQRKLLLSEIEFITNYYDELDKDKPKIFLYVGAAAGYHIYYLAQLFPELEFHLYDENKFYKKLYELPNVKIFSHYLTNKIAKTYKNKNLFFYCDIGNLRIVKEYPKSIKKSNKIVSDNRKFQMELYKIINPKKALLKFRLPWSGGYTEYLDGDIYFQVWQGKYSTESRLVPNGKMKKYDNLVYEDRMYYFNKITRRKYYKHDIPCYGHCYDCRSEIEIIRNYLKKFKKGNTKKNVCKMGAAISASIPIAAFLPKFVPRYLFKGTELAKWKI